MKLKIRIVDKDKPIAVDYVQDTTIASDGISTNHWDMPKCPTCEQWPTYNLNPCPFCGQELLYPEKRRMKVNERN